MASLNKVMLIGNLGGDPELRYMPDGTPVTQFSLATNRKWERDGETQEETTWFNVACFRRLAEVVNEHLEKGARCYVEGSLRTRSWEDKEGKKHYRTEVRAHSVVFL